MGPYIQIPTIHVHVHRLPEFSISCETICASCTPALYTVYLDREDYSFHLPSITAWCLAICYRVTVFQLHMDNIWFSFYSWSLVFTVCLLVGWWLALNWCQTTYVAMGSQCYNIHIAVSTVLRMFVGSLKPYKLKLPMFTMSIILSANSSFALEVMWFCAQFLSGL